MASYKHNVVSSTGTFGMRSMRRWPLVFIVCTHSHWYGMVSAVLKCRFINMCNLRLICRGMQSMRDATPPPPKTHTRRPTARDKHNVVE